MKYKGSITINKPQKVVTDIFANSDHMKEYQDGFISKELISGEKGKEGARSKMVYEFNGKMMEMEETITKNNLPEAFEAFYHHKHMDNTMKCSFIALNDTTTRYDYEFEYTRISWIMPKLMMTFFPGMIRKQSEKWMNQFKAFVERQ